MDFEMPSDQSPLVVVGDKQFQKLQDCNVLGRSAGGPNNIASSGHRGPDGPIKLGATAPFVDTLLLSVKVRVKPWLHACMNGLAADHRAGLICRPENCPNWPLDTNTSYGPYSVKDIRSFKNIDAVPESVKWIVFKRQYAGHSMFHFEAVGQHAMRGVRVLLGRSVDGLTPAKVFIASWVLHDFRQEYRDTKKIADYVMGAVFGVGVEAALFLGEVESEIKPEVHATADVWGCTIDLFDSIRDFCTIRKCHKGKVTSETIINPEDTGPLYVREYLEGQTAYINARGNDNRQLCMYDKGVQARTTGAITYLQPLWSMFGHDGNAPVRRIEFRHGPNWLADRNFFYKDLSNIENTLFKLGMEEIRLVLPETATRMRRADMHPDWLAILQTVSQAPDSSWIYKPREPNMRKDFAKVFSQAVGCTATLIEALRDYSPNLRADPSSRGLWAPSSILKYKEAKRRAMEAISAQLDENFLEQPTQTPQVIKDLADQLQSVN